MDLAQMEDRISALKNINEASFQTIVNCAPEKVTGISFDWHGYAGKIPNLSKFTSLRILSFPQCGGITNEENLSTATNLESLSLHQCGMHERLSKIDFSKLTNLKSLSLFGNGLWTEDIKGLANLRDNQELSIDLEGNALIDPEVLLELPPNFRIKLGGNVNLSAEFKARLTEHFGSNVGL